MATEREVVKAARLRGLTLNKAALLPILRTVKDEDDPAGALALILDGVKEAQNANPGMARIVSEEIVTTVIADLSKVDVDVESERFQLLNAFDQPRLAYDPIRKAFSLAEVARGGSLHAAPEAKVHMLRDRYLLAQQRVQRNPIFTKPLIDQGGEKSFQELTTVDALLGADTTGGDKLILGMITQVEEGEYYLEDLNGSVALNLAGCEMTPGLFTEGCIVLTLGHMGNDGRFQCLRMGFPPPEPRSEALEAIGPSLDLFKSGFTRPQLARMQELEAKDSDAMFVLVSDLNLDKPGVLEKLRTMFEAFEECEPLPLFVLIGDFTSKPIVGDAAQLVNHFKALADLISEFEHLASEGKFVFVPGPKDPGAGNTLPRPPLASVFTSYLKEKVPHARFASNPCRLRYFASEIVVMREDVVKKMSRNVIVPPAAGAERPDMSQDDGPESSEMDVTEHLVKTLVDQAHLCPLPLSVRPVHWAHDHALRLYPAPSMLVLADRSDQFSWRYEDCLAINPGSFPTDFSFVVYRPASDEIEFSRI